MSSEGLSNFAGKEVSLKKMKRDECNDCRAVKRWHFVLLLTKARPIVASQPEREVTGGY